MRKSAWRMEIWPPENARENPGQWPGARAVSGDRRRRHEAAPTLEKPTMTAVAMNPSTEGSWTRVAPIAATFAVAVAFVLSLFVFVQTLKTSYLLTTHAPVAQTTQTAVSPNCVIVQAPAVPCNVGG